MLTLFLGPIALICAFYVLATSQKTTIKNGSIWGAVKTMITFCMTFAFLIVVVPSLFNWGFNRLQSQIQTSPAAAVIEQTVANGQMIIESVAGSTMPSLPNVAPAAPSLPSLPSLPNVAPVQRAAAPAAVAPATRSTAPATAPAAPATSTWNNGLGRDGSGRAIEGPAAPATHAPLGTDDSGNNIQGPVAPSFFGSPTIKAITGEDGGPSWASSPTIATIQTYTVRRGDTMFLIAQKHYGNGNLWTRICNANVIVDCSNLTVGKTIVLP